MTLLQLIMATNIDVHSLKSGTGTGSPKHVFFITGVTVRLQPRDIQVTDSDTHLCTRLCRLRSSKHLQNMKKQLGRNGLKGQHATKSVFTLSVDGGQFLLATLWGVILSHPCMFSI